MKPLILDFKVSRTDSLSDALPFTYDHSLSMNIVVAGGSTIPFIEFGRSATELMTKTRANRENDDECFRMEMATKTEVRRERDESSDIMLELMTKTLTTREADDTRTSHY